MMRKLLICIGSLSVLIACTKEEPNVELIRNMMQTPAVKTQEANPDSKSKTSMRVPPEGTVAIGKEVYRFNGKPALADQLKNPLAGNQESTKAGQEYFEIYCMVCHGKQGAGDGLVAPKLEQRPPPSLLTAKIKSWSDGRIYHVITTGQGMMGAYDTQIQPEDRWKIVNYIRELQKQ